MLAMFFGIVVFSLAGFGFMLSIPTQIYKQKLPIVLRNPRMISGIICCLLSALCVFGLLDLLPA